MGTSITAETKAGGVHTAALALCRTLAQTAQAE
jgi:hypothetical protein